MGKTLHNLPTNKHIYAHEWAQPNAKRRIKKKKEKSTFSTDNKVMIILIPNLNCVCVCLFCCIFWHVSVVYE